MLQTSEYQRSSKFNDLITYFFNHPQAVPDESQLCLLVCECMFHGEVEVLSEILAQEHVQRLDISHNGQNNINRHLSTALQTLLKAMPGDCHVGQLKLLNQRLEHDEISLLFELLNRMPRLESLHLESCHIEIRSIWGLSDCPRLLKLKHLYFHQTNQPFRLLWKILAASQLSSLHLLDNYGIAVEQHCELAQALMKQAELRELGLLLPSGEDGKTALHFYATEFLANQTTIEHLDLSEVQLSPESCNILWRALENKSMLTKLSLSFCWRGLSWKLDSGEPAKLISLKSLVSLDLSRNGFSKHATPLLMALANHPKLQHVDLDRANLGDAIEGLAFTLENNTTLASLRLPFMQNKFYARLVEAMQTNRSLRSLSVPDMEGDYQRHPDETRQLYPSYFALRELVAINQDRFALIEGGMKAFLGGLGGVDSNHVSPDIARYAANMAVTRNGDKAVASSLLTLNQSAHAEGLAAQERLREGKETSQKALPAQENDKH